MKPWTIRLTMPPGKGRIAYATGMPRFWTKRGARRRCDRLNAISHGLGYWKPVKTKKEAW